MHMHHILHYFRWCSFPRPDPSRDLVPDIHFHDADTWDSCDRHYLDYMIFLDWPCDFNLWSHIFMIFWLCYTIITHPGHFVFIIFMSQHACTVLLYMISSWLLLLLLLLLVLDTAKYIVLIILCSTCTVTVFSYSLVYCSFPFVYSCWSSSDEPLLFFSV